MSSLSVSLPPSNPPVRTGRAALFLRLADPKGSRPGDFTVYRVHKLGRSDLKILDATKGFQVAVEDSPWSHRNYSVYRRRNPVGKSIACTCPDHSIRRARCKHIGALVALGLISERKQRNPQPISRATLRQLAKGGAL